MVISCEGSDCNLILILISSEKRWTTNPFVLHVGERPVRPPMSSRVPASLSAQTKIQNVTFLTRFLLKTAFSLSFTTLFNTRGLWWDPRTSHRVNKQLRFEDRPVFKTTLQCQTAIYNAVSECLTCGLVHGGGQEPAMSFCRGARVSHFELEEHDTVCTNWVQLYPR